MLPTATALVRSPALVLRGTMIVMNAEHASNSVSRLKGVAAVGHVPQSEIGAVLRRERRQNDRR